jgi:hypothetical protein
VQTATPNSASSSSASSASSASASSASAAAETLDCAGGAGQGLRSRSHSASSFQGIFELLDSDGNGEISKIEFIKALRSRPTVAELFNVSTFDREGGGRHPMTQESAARVQMERAFQLIDTDHSKTISKSEFGRFVAVELNGAASPAGGRRVHFGGGSSSLGGGGGGGERDDLNSVASSGVVDTDFCQTMQWGAFSQPFEWIAAVQEQ